MRVALSPCPNDTWLFFAWLKGLVGQHLPPEATFGDIQQLNEWALEKRFPLIKLSFSCFAKLLDVYQLLPVGAALGFHCGPKIIASTPLTLDQLPSKVIAIPGRETTAHWLLDFFFPNLPKKHFCLYHEIADCIKEGIADCGVIIHESRFTFQKQGFHEVVDLGEMWHQKTDLPLPLGALAIAKDLPDTTKQEVIQILRASLSYSQEYPEQTYPFMAQYSQEMDHAVMQSHVDTYVTSETYQLSDRGIQAIQKLIGCSESVEWVYKEACQKF